MELNELNDLCEKAEVELKMIDIKRQKINIKLSTLKMLYKIIEEANKVYDNKLKENQAPNSIQLCYSGNVVISSWHCNSDDYFASSVKMYNHEWKEELKIIREKCNILKELCESLGISCEISEETRFINDGDEIRVLYLELCVPTPTSMLGESATEKVRAYFKKYPSH